MKTSYTQIFAFAFFLAVFYLAACKESQQAESYIEGTSERSGDKEIRYFRDSRTGLCFAERGQSDTYAFTCVPCDSVEKLIKKTCK